jgi:signal transduction histidine kinase
MAVGPVTHGVHSVFAKLFAIMIVMAACLLLAVGGFFWSFVVPGVNDALQQMQAEFTRGVAAAQPDLDTAREIAARTGVQIAYDGPRGAWSTTGDQTAVAKARNARPSTIPAMREATVIDAPDGGQYAFMWQPGRRLNVAHSALVVALLVILAAVVLAAHEVLRRLLEPLRTLGDAVTSVGEGRLVTIERRHARDEFGALTTAFNQMIERVREMMRSRDQLLLDVSHELRSPLTRLTVAVELLPETEPRDRMRADVREMDAMVTELLEIERLRNDGGLRKTPTDVGALAEDVARAFEGHAPGVVVSTQRDLVAPVDAERLRRVFRNLIENALKYALPDSQAVTLSVTREDDAIVIRVADDGRGIPEGDLSSVFVPFFRVDRSRSKQTGGYGLGLSLCQRIVQAHGGTITVAAQHPRGAVFTVTLSGMA